jgi:ribosomal protein S2
MKKNIGKSFKPIKTFFHGKNLIQIKLTKDHCPNFSSSPLYNELIRLGAFQGNFNKWLHPSQTKYILGYRNNYSFYNMRTAIMIFQQGVKFVKAAIKNKKSVFVFVGNPDGTNEIYVSYFKHIKQIFFPNQNWKQGFFTQNKKTYNFILILYSVTQNQDAFQEAVKKRIPVICFATPLCDISNVDYPILFNLKNAKIWFAYFCNTLFLKTK